MDCGCVVDGYVLKPCDEHRKGGLAGPYIVPAGVVDLEDIEAEPGVITWVPDSDGTDRELLRSAMALLERFKDNTASNDVALYGEVEALIERVGER